MIDILIIIVDSVYEVNIEMVPPVDGVLVDDASNLTNLVSVAY